MNNQQFFETTGHYPANDDLERCNCSAVGTSGHQQCGICLKCGQPRFICGCLATLTEKHPEPVKTRTAADIAEYVKMADEDAQEARCYLASIYTPI